MTIMDPRLRGLVFALGDGATAEMGCRALAWMDEQASALPDPGPSSEFRPENILGLAEVARELNVPTAVARALVSKEQNSFPPPIARLAATKIWDREQVLDWKRGNDELLGSVDA